MNLENALPENNFSPDYLIAALTHSHISSPADYADFRGKSTEEPLRTSAKKQVCVSPVNKNNFEYLGVIQDSVNGLVSVMGYQGNQQ